MDLKPWPKPLISRASPTRILALEECISFSTRKTSNSSLPQGKIRLCYHVPKYCWLIICILLQKKKKKEKQEERIYNVSLERLFSIILCLYWGFMFFQSTFSNIISFFTSVVQIKDMARNSGTVF